MSAIDGLNTLVRGQKLPIFSGSGLPHANLAAQIARQAKVRSADSKFAVVFAAIDRAVLFMNLANDLATMYERAGRRLEAEGSTTMIPILSMLEDDKTHPISDLTDYITEGQIILSRELYRKGLRPPIDVLPSLSRLKDKGIGEGKTREDHAGTMNQLFAAYARGKDAKELMTILGEAALTDTDKLYAKFADEFEKQYVSQGYETDRKRKPRPSDACGKGTDSCRAKLYDRFRFMNPEFLEEALLYPKQSVALDLDFKNIMSVNVPVYQFKTSGSDLSEILPYGFATTSGEMDDALLALSQILPDLLRLAQIEKTVQLLSREIEKTRRRVNALEYVMIPQLEETIRYITMKLEENERGNLSRLMKAKEMILKQAGYGQNQ